MGSLGGVYFALEELWQELTALAVLVANLPTSEVVGLDICIIG
jgi:hypothetical protein